MQTIEEVTTRMPYATYFSVLDASSGYWQISCDQESAKLHIQQPVWLLHVQAPPIRLIVCSRHISKSDGRNV